MLDAVSGRFGGKKSGTAVADPAFVSYLYETKAFSFLLHRLFPPPGQFRRLAGVGTLCGRKEMLYENQLLYLGLSGYVLAGNLLYGQGLSLRWD